VTPLLLAASLLCAWPQDPPSAPERLPTVVVEGRATDLVGIAERASEGVTGQEELRRRPLLRPGEVLETVPGIVVTQHSGTGKGNQLFARGFNLDHGTDLATSLWGMPLNLPSHGHGQGYTDLELVIPELIDTVRWRLGPYDVRDGDFGSAGAVDIDYVRRLDRGFVRVEGGGFGHARTVAADSYRVLGGDLLLAVELHHDDGPFAVEQDYAQRVGHVSWATDEFRVLAFGHDAEWTATDQIPRRAVRDGRLGRFDSADPTAGGTTSMYGGVAEWTPRLRHGRGLLRGYGFGYDLDLYSNFTYAAVDPVDGDQIQQRDRRTAFGLEASRTWQRALAGLDTEWTFGTELRSDFVTNGLHDATRRRRTGTVRRDDIREHAFAVFGEVKAQWTDWLRTTAGVRADQYWFDVDSDNAANSGRDDDAIVNGKGGLVLGPWAATEVYANVGTGFHSNDARGVLTRDDPATPAPGDGAPVDPLVRSKGAELGLRTSAVDGLQTTVSLWALDVASELLFVGDAGTTEPSRATRRCGIELANHWRPVPWLALDCDVTVARARFRGVDAAGDRVPGSVPVTVAAGLAVDWTDGLSTALRLRHLGHRPLVEDGSVRSSTTTLVNARVQWRLDERREFGLDVLNLLDSDDSDIEYFYESRLPGEAAPVEDLHFHPVEPFALRLSFTARF
jgi:hypothetical protein